MCIVCILHARERRGEQGRVRTKGEEGVVVRPSLSTRINPWGIAGLPVVGLTNICHLGAISLHKCRIAFLDNFNTKKKCSLVNQ